MKKFSAVFLSIFLLSCGSDDRVDDPIPFQHFPDIIVNINLPTYSPLQIDGGHVVIPYGAIPAGIKGIILHRENSTTFRAFEQNCSFQPYDPCASVEAFALDMKDACCGSVFRYIDGEPIGGLAWRPLGQYNVSVVGSTVTITDEVLNY